MSKPAEVISIKRGETPPLPDPIPYGTPDPMDALIEMVDIGKEDDDGKA